MVVIQLVELQINTSFLSLSPHVDCEMNGVSSGTSLWKYNRLQWRRLNALCIGMIWYIAFLQAGFRIDPIRFQDFH